MSTKDWEPARALWRQRGIFPGAQLEHRPSTTSTNDDLLAMARSGALHGTTLVADHQTRGRGRHGALWYSPPRDNLTFSVLLRPKLDAADFGVLPLLAGLAVREVVATRVEGAVKIKWPNDIWVDGKKIAGILVESVMRGRVLQAAVVGIGINVKTMEFPPELATTATSLALARARDLEQSVLLIDVLASLEHRLMEFSSGGFDEQLAELNHYDGLLGKRVDVDGIRGTAAGIGEGGVLLVLSERGIERCIAGTVVIDDFGTR